jgi:WD40 repeat protein
MQVGRIDTSPITALPGMQTSPRAVHWLSDDQILTAERGNATQSGALRLWFPYSGEATRLRGHGTSVHRARLASDGTFVLSADGDNALIIWDPLRCVPIARHHVGTAESHKLVDLAYWVRDRRHFCARAYRMPQKSSTGIWVHEIADEGHWIRQEQADEHCPDATSMTVSNDGFFGAVGTQTGKVIVYSIAPTGAWQRKAEWRAAPNVPVRDIAFLDTSGRFVAAACEPRDSDSSESATVQLWDWAGQRQLAALSEFKARVMRLAVDPQFRRLACGCSDGSILLYELPLDLEGSHISLRARLEGHTGPVRALAFHPTEPRLVSGSEDRTAKVWDLERLLEILPLRGPLGAINDLAFDPEGKRLAAASAGSLGRDNAVWLWESKRLGEEAKRQREFNSSAYLLVQRQAYDCQPSLEEARNRINQARDSTGSRDSVLDLASRNFDEFVSRPWYLNQGAWEIVSRADATDQYETALRWAQRAHDTSPEDGGILNTLGVALFRTARRTGTDYDRNKLREALKILEQSRARNNDHPADLAFLAMVHYQLGDQEKARQLLADAQDHLENQTWEAEHRQTVHQVLKEARSMIASKGN